MKIIHIILGKANPNRMNGVNKVVNSLASSQASLGHDVKVWGITPTPEEINFPQRNYETRLFQALRHKCWIHHSITHAIEDTEAGTMFHIHGGFVPEFFHIQRELRNAGFQYVFTPHGAYNKVALQKNKWVKKLYLALFESSLVKNASSLHFMGESELNYANKLFPKASKALIPNGQNISIVDSSTRCKKQNDKLIFTTCGRIDIHTKGLDIMMEAFSTFLKKSGQKAEWWVIGGNGEINELKQLGNHFNVTSSVKFLGAQFGEEKFELLKQSTAFFQPSRNEGLPGSVLEGAMCSLPAVVSKESNMGNYIKQYGAGICLEHNTATELVDAMMKIAKVASKDEVWEQWKESAYKMVRREFDWAKISNQHITNYREVVSRIATAQIEMIWA